MKRAKIFFITGLIMMVISGAILYWQTVKLSKAATPVADQYETWKMSFLRQMQIKGLFTSNIESVIQLGPAGWIIYGCDTDPCPENQTSANYWIEYSASDWQQKIWADANIATRHTIGFDTTPTAAGLDDWDPAGLLSETKKGGIYGASVITRAGDTAQGISWPAKWNVHIHVNTP